MATARIRFKQTRVVNGKFNKKNQSTLLQLSIYTIELIKFSSLHHAHFYSPDVMLDNTFSYLLQCQLFYMR
jgi:hypothetical protein